jgi:hypothetical protein
MHPRLYRERMMIYDLGAGCLSGIGDAVMCWGTQRVWSVGRRKTTWQ